MRKIENTYCIMCEQDTCNVYGYWTNRGAKIMEFYCSNCRFHESYNDGHEAWGGGRPKEVREEISNA